MFERYYRELLSFCLRTVQNRDVAADVVQESYARLFAIQRADVPIAEPRALLYRMARGIMVDQFRHDRVRDHDGLDDLDEIEQPALPAHQQPEAILASNQAVQAYLGTIDSLPPRCRTVFVMHVFDDLTHAQISERMGTSVSMIEKHIARGRAACRECARQLLEPARATAPAQAH